LWAAAVVLGCSHSGSPPSPEHAPRPNGAAEEASPAGGPASLLGRTWKLEAIGDGAAAPVEGTQVTLSFPEEGGIAGSSGCNRYQAALEMGPDGRWSIGPVASTRMACPEPVMAQEDRYLAALGAVTGYRIAADRLTLTDDKGVALTFVPIGESAP